MAAFVVLSGDRVESRLAMHSRGGAQRSHACVLLGEAAGDPGRAFFDESHPYAVDLDIFGKGSLFELLSSARTRSGEQALASWLKAPASRVEIARRQQSFKAIAKSDYFPAKFVRGQRDAAKNGIQAWAVTAASENADSGLHNED